MQARIVALLAVSATLAWATAAGVVGAAFAPQAPAPGRPAKRPPPTSLGNPPEPVRFDGDTVLVRFRTGVAAATAASQVAADGGRVGERVGATGYVVVHTNGNDPHAMVARLRHDAGVAGAELNYVRTTSALPNDPVFRKTVGQTDLLRIRVPEAWTLAPTAGAGVKVAVVDTGVALTQPELAGRILPGHDFVNNDDNADDDEGHGTYVASIVAAATNNGVGIAGIAGAASIVPVKVLDAGGTGTDADVAAGITWAADAGASIINLSLGGPGRSDALQSAVDYATAKGAVVVAAAGNSGTDQPMYPAALDHVVAVSGTDWSGQLTYFSSFGPWVDLAAPAVDVTSVAGPSAEYYDTVSGTSFAAPQVSGVAALVRGQHPDWTAAQVVDDLERTARDLGRFGVDPQFGYGWLDAAAALGGAPASRSRDARDQYEPNDLPDRATLLTVPAQTTATLAPEGDVDWYAVQVTTPVELTFTVYGGHDAADLRGGNLVVAAYDPQLHVLGTHDDSIYFQDGENIAVAAATPGTYYFAVRNSGGARSSGVYSVGVSSTYPAGRFFPSDRTYIDSWVRSAAAGDVTGDGRNDVLVTTTSGAIRGDIDDSLLLLRQRDDGYFAAPIKVPRGSNPYEPAEVVTGDFNADGKTDAAVATLGGVELFLQSAGTLTYQTLIPNSAAAERLVTGDIDGDGRTDIVVDARTAVFALLNTVSGWKRVDIDSRWQDISEIGVGDVNGDGRTDVVESWSQWGDWYLRVMPQTAPGVFGGTDMKVDGALRGVADVTHDGRDDIVVGQGANVAVYPQTAQGTLGTPIVYSGVSPILVADVNGDGLNDVVGVDAAGLVVLQQTTSGFTEWPAGAFFGPIAAADVNGDGAVDFLGIGNAGWGQGFVSVLRQQTPRWTPPRAWVAGATPTDGADGVGTSVAPVVRFARPLDSTSVSPQTVQLLDGQTGRAVAAATSYDAAANAVTIAPAAPLTASEPYVVRISGVRDSSGNQLDDRREIHFFTGAIVDQTPPDTVFRDPDIRFRGGFESDEPGVTYECSIDGGSFKPCAEDGAFGEPPLPQGSRHTDRVRAIDASGNVDPTPAAITWTVPGPDVLGNDELVGATGSVTGSTVQSMGSYRWTAPFTGRATFDTRGSDFDTVLYVSTGDPPKRVAENDDEVPSTVTTSIVSFDATAGVTYSIRVSGFSDQRWSDVMALGNFTLSWRMAGDTTPPETTITSGPTGSVPATSARFSFTANEPRSSFECSLDGSPFLACVPPKTYANLAIGTHTFRVRAIDAAGNVDATPATRSWTATATPPANDAFGSAMTLAGVGGAVSGDTTFATTETGEPHPFAGGHSVWFSWTAPASGTTEFDTVGSVFDTTLAVYTGSTVSGLTQVAADNDSGGAGTSRVTFAATAGTTYAVQLDGFNPTTGQTWFGSYRLNWTQGDRPANDDFANASAIAPGTASIGESTLGATKEPGEPDHAGDPGGHSIWFRWTAPTNETLTLQHGADFEAALAVYTGTSLSTLTLVAANDDAAPGVQGQVSFYAIAGQSYAIAIDGRDGGLGWTGFQILPESLVPPANDNFAGAFVLTGSSGTFAGDTRGGKIASCETGWNTVWFAWTAPASGTVTLDTVGSSFDTFLAVYTGSFACTTTLVASDSDSGGSYTSKLSFTATAGTTYHIAVGGEPNPTLGYTGRYVLHWSGPGTAPAQGAPPNDPFAAARVLDPAGGSVAGDTTFATIEAGEPTALGDAGGHSVWFSWTPTASGTAVVDTVGSYFDTKLAVYTGTALSSLARVAEDNDGGGARTSRATFPAVAGTTYRIQLDGFFGTPANRWYGAYSLQWAVAPPPPPNDNFGDARALSGATGSTTGSTTKASLEAGEPMLVGNAGGRSVWFTWTAPAAGPATFDTVGSSFDTTLGVYTGTSLTGLAKVAEDNDSGGNGTSSVTFSAVAGTTYRIQLDGFYGTSASAWFGAYTLRWNGAAPPSSSNLLTNPSFEGSLNGWSSWHGSLSLASDGVSGSGAAKVSVSSGSTAYSIYTSPRPVSPTTAGVAYTGAGSVRSDTPGHRICLALREWSSAGALVAEKLSCVTSTTAWQAIPAVSYTTAQSGGSLELYVLEQSAAAGDTFEVDALSLTSGSSPPPPPPDTTIDSGPSGTTTLTSATFAFSSTASGARFECALDAAAFAPCTSPTSYSALALGTHTFQVRSIDLVGQVDPTPASRTWTIQSSNAPPNDMFANAQALSGTGGTVTGDSTYATREAGEPVHAGSLGNNSVWYAWTAPAAGTVSLDTAGSSFDTLLAVYTGTSVSALTQVAANDDIPGGVTSALTFNAVAGTTYRIAVDGWQRGGTVQLHWSLAGAPPGDTTPPDTSIVDGPSGTVTSTTATFSFASTEAGSTFQCQLDAAAWTACTSPQTYSGLAAGSHTFSVKATDAAGNTDPTPATRTWTIQTSNAPPNDMFANAQQLTGASGTATGDSTYATREPGEPIHAGSQGNNSVWYAWTAPGAGTLTLDTFTSNFDTLLAVYTGTSVSALTPVAANDDVNGGVTSKLSFAAVSGTTYRIAVDGWQHGGSVVLNWSFAASSPPPADTTPPDTTITDGPSGTVSATSASFSFTATETATFQCQLDTATWTSCTSPTAYGNLAAGSHTFSVRAIDAAGNIDPTPATRSWTIQPAPPPPGTNLLPNGDFESGLGGWASWHGTLTAATDGVKGAAAAKVAIAAGNTSFSIFTSPRPVTGTTAGTTYTAGGSVRSDTPGHNVCLAIREWASTGSEIAEKLSCVTSTTAWQSFPAVTYTTGGSGGTLELFVIEQGAGAADTFEVDGLTLTQG